MPRENVDRGTIIGHLYSMDLCTLTIILELRCEWHLIQSIICLVK